MRTESTPCRPYHNVYSDYQPTHLHHLDSPCTQEKSILQLTSWLDSKISSDAPPKHLYPRQLNTSQPKQFPDNWQLRSFSVISPLRCHRSCECAISQQLVTKHSFSEMWLRLIRRLSKSQDVVIGFPWMHVWANSALLFIQCWFVRKWWWLNHRKNLILSTDMDPKIKAS